MLMLSRLCASAAIFLTLSPSISFAACGENDLACFRRGFLERGQQIDSLARELGLTQQLVQSKTEENAVLKQSNTELHATLQSIKPALQAGQRAWHEDPKLWYGLGVGTGVVATVVIVVISVWAAGQLRN